MLLVINIYYDRKIQIWIKVLKEITKILKDGIIFLRHVLTAKLCAAFCQSKMRKTLKSCFNFITKIDQFVS